MDSICNSCDVLKINIVRTASIISFFNRNFDFKVPKLGLTCQAYLVLLSVKSIMWRFCLFRCEFCLPFYCKFSTSFLALQNLRAIRRKISCLTHRSSNKWSGHPKELSLIFWIYQSLTVNTFNFRFIKVQRSISFATCICDPNFNWYVASHKSLSQLS